MQTLDFTVSNDFRKIVLVRDPVIESGSEVSSTLRATRAVNLTGVSGTFSVMKK